MSAPDPAAPTFDPNEQLASVLLSNVRHVNTRIALSKTNRAFREAYKNHTAEELPPSLDFSGYDNRGKLWHSLHTLTAAPPSCTC
jgi:hypothetical protein